MISYFFRIPATSIVRDLCRLVENGSLALTSANKSGEPSALRVEVYLYFGFHIIVVYKNSQTFEKYNYF